METWHQDTDHQHPSLSGRGADGEYVVFISDAHLGSGSDSLQRERELCAFLDSMFLHTDGQAAAQPKLFLLGDMFDFWFTYRHVVPRGHVRLLGKLAELSDHGVEIHFFIGNHDMWLFDYLTKECGVIMHDEPEAFDIDGRRFLIGHGDGLGHLDKGFDLLRGIFRSRVNQRLFTLLPSSLMFPFAHRWSDNNKEKHARQDTLHYLGDDREGIVLYCRERLAKEHFDYCVFGHRHTPLVREISCQSPVNNAQLMTANNDSHQSADHPSSATIYLNTGDWLFNRNYAVYSPADHSLKLYDLHKGQIC